MNSCKNHPHAIETTQLQISLKQGAKVGDGCLTSWKFDQDACRKALARMIVIDELPFKFVEGEGFRSFMAMVCPRFIIPSRWTVARDCVDLYTSEKKNLKSLLNKSSQRVCLTTDTWTSIQKINYMCLTAHFIDKNWKLQKRIINFCPITSHKDEAISLAIVVDGLKDISESVTRVRDAVKYVKQSPARLNKFKECAKLEKIESKSSLCLDVSTRWNSTFLMLNVAQKFERAFERFDEDDPYFKLEPTSTDWNNVRLFASLLQVFYEITLNVSGSLYVTANTFAHDISSIHTILKEWQESEDIDVYSMGARMKKKFDKYWGDPEKMNKLFYIAVVLDPRHKLDFVEFMLVELYGVENVENGARVGKMVKDTLVALYKNYKEKMEPNTSNMLSIQEPSEIEPKTLSQTDLKRQSILEKSRDKRHKVLVMGVCQSLTSITKWLKSIMILLYILGWWKLLTLNLVLSSRPLLTQRAAAAAASTRRRLHAPPPLLRRKIVSGQFDEENPSAQISSCLLVQGDEGVSYPVVDRIGVIYRSLP
ncbi:zinc finger BED domain-containing protein RICESLEEPER 2-like [Dorcoceras hygrometricum]|uniref:Zinc finger BED domain-containing protein RICESLEEPER 2-like n=1 Tax=Dorcoceras hygrometricum TaxID=472368 RepID=A0A2Z7C524_9LAMI|nr:zinc finger BED domain-containing protein RICESLEEPER 2-like [Dorcoceras hygrometricum]